MLKIDIITIFPRMFENFTDYGVIKEGDIKSLYELNVYDLRDFTLDRHRKVDDRPYGGGPGMVMAVQPIDAAVAHIKEKNKVSDPAMQKVILLSPKGKRLEQDFLRTLSKFENIIMICGRYEGVDERVNKLGIADMELSIGDYILTGGEVPAMVVIDGVIRLLKGVVGREESTIRESFEENLLDYPQYTRPEEYKGLKVPEILLSGNHQQIEKWRIKESFDITSKNRPDLFDKNN
jgi:tRNA (guanine37-N1)-methyltransferase